jgi:ABC-type spermidine/putrescine transport system permease subunit I
VFLLVQWRSRLVTLGARPANDDGERREIAILKRIVLPLSLPGLTAGAVKA